MFDGLLLPSLRSTRPARLEFDPTDGLNRGRLCWPLMEPGGKIADEISPRRLRGTLVNTPTRGVTPAGRVTLFGGGGAASPHINLGKAGFIGSVQLPFTFTAWIKPNSTAGYDTIFGQYTDYATSGGIGKMLRSDLGVLTYYTTSSAAAYQSVGAGAITAGAWNFVAVTVEGPITGPTYRLVVNRTVSTGTLAQLYASGPTVTDVYLGNSERNTLFGPSEGLNGAMRLANMWPRALPVSELLRLYRAPFAGLIDPADRLFVAFRATGSTVWNEIISDAATAGESNAVAVTFNPTITDSGAAGESNAVAVTFTPTITDSGAAGESSAVAVTFNPTISDAGTVGESFIGGLLLAVVMSDSLTAAESNAAVVAFTAAMSGDLAAAEAFTAGVAFTIAMSASVAAGESFFGGLSFSSTISDGIGFADAFIYSISSRGGFVVMSVVATVGQIVLIEEGPAAQIVNVTEQQSRT